MTIEFGKVVKELRVGQNFTRADVVRRLPINKSQYYYIESGDRDASKRVAQELVRALKVPLSFQATFLLQAAGYGYREIINSLDFYNHEIVSSQFKPCDTFGTELWVRRTNYDWGLREFAYEACVSPAMVSLLENDLMLPRSGVVRKLLNTLEIPVCERAEFLLCSIGYRRQFVREILLMHK